MKEAGKSDFAANLCKLMKKEGIKAHDLGEAIGISRQTITQYMKDEVEPKMRAFKAIAEYFNVSCDYLLGRTLVEAADETFQAVYDNIGLSDSALKELSLPDSKQANETGKALMYRFTVNLLLENPHGRNFLLHLAGYLFAHHKTIEESLVLGNVKSLESRITKEAIKETSEMLGCDTESAKKYLTKGLEKHWHMALSQLEKILPQEEEA